MAVGFSCWKEQEPNNRRGKEGCMEMRRDRAKGSCNSPFSWNDKPCNFKIRAVCERKSNKQWLLLRFRASHRVPIDSFPHQNLRMQLACTAANTDQGKYLCWDVRMSLAKTVSRRLEECNFITLKLDLILSSPKISINVLQMIFCLFLNECWCFL